MVERHVDAFVHVVRLKADTLSLAAWQVGVYGFMAVARWLIRSGVKEEM